MNHMLLNVPMWRAKMQWQRSVHRTLRVQMRERGSLASLRLGVVGVGGCLGRRDSSS